MARSGNEAKLTGMWNRSGYWSSTIPCSRTAWLTSARASFDSVWHTTYMNSGACLLPYVPRTTALVYVPLEQHQRPLVRIGLTSNPPKLQTIEPIQMALLNHTKTHPIRRGGVGSKRAECRFGRIPSSIHLLR